MKRFEFIQVLMLLLMCVSAQAQQFTLTVDTVKVDTSDITCSGTFASRLSFIAKQKDKIYCLYNSKGVVRVDGKCRFNQLLTLDEMGQIQQFPLSDDVTYNISRGEGLFVRNDSLILRTHGSYSTSVFTVKWEKEHGYKDDEIATYDYYWDKKASQWIRIPFADDHIYEDKQYKVSVWANGEWGTYTRFLTKKTGKEYIYRCTPTRVYKQKDGYYLIGVDSIMCISDPTKGHIYQGERCEDVDLKKLYTKPAALIKTPEHVYTSFMLKKRLYLIMKSAEGICLASYQDGSISKVMELGCNYTPYIYQSYMRDCDSPKDHTLLMFIDRKTTNNAILTVEGTKMRLRYLIYK